MSRSPSIAFLPALLLATATLQAQAVLESDPTPDSLGYWNAEAWVPLEADGARIGVRFDATFDEPAIRALLQATPGLAAGQAQQARVFLGHSVLLDTASGTSAETAWALCTDLLEMQGVLSASPLLWAPYRDPYYLTEEILVRWKASTPLAQRE